MSLETILSIVTEEELRDIIFWKEVIKRAISEGKIKIIGKLFEKAATVFIFGHEGFRQKLIDTIYSNLQCLELFDIIEIGKESILGNVLTIYYFVKKCKVITSQKIRILATLSALKYINDPLIFELVPLKDQLIIDVDERITELNQQEEIDKATKICEWLFSNDLIAKNEDTVKGLNILYANSSSPELRFKGDIISSLLKRRLDLFSHSLEKIYQQKITNEKDIIRYYTEIYDFLVKINVPIFFDFENLRFNNVLYNGNFFFVKYIDRLGTERLLFPFEQTELANVQKVYDLNSGMYITPKGRVGKILFHDIFSFKKSANVTKVYDKQIRKVKQLSEVEIEEKIRSILEDQNITPHGPVEKADIFTTKVLVNNERDLRNSAFILKGKGYPKVNLESIATNLLKAAELPVDIIFLVHTGVLLDEAQEQFIKQCNLHRKMYCIIGPIELTKLLIAYSKLS